MGPDQPGDREWTVIKSIATVETGKGTTFSRAERDASKTRALAPEVVLIVVGVMTAVCVQAQTSTIHLPVAPRGCAFMKVADAFTATTTPKEFRRNRSNIRPRGVFWRDLTDIDSWSEFTSREGVGFQEAPQYVIAETTPVRLPLISPAFRHVDSQTDSFVLVCGLHGFNDSK